MNALIISNTQEQYTKNFTSQDQLMNYLKEIKNATLIHEDNEKIYIETSDDISYEYFKKNC